MRRHTNEGSLMTTIIRGPQTMNGELAADDVEEPEGFGIGPYDITSSPNDFNVATIFDFMKSGTVIIPEFQRHYVWDLKQASKLIESLLIGLPIPQIFLYEEEPDKFLVIDGQQRLMTIYYFLKGRFPKPTARPTLREVFSESARVPDDVLQDNALFYKFSLSLDEQRPGVPNPFHGKTYETLDEYKTRLDLRTIRNIIIKQVSPQGDDAAYEVFHRLNTGGVNLTPQEIRMCLHHKSVFYKMLAEINVDPRWRGLLGIEHADLHFKDVEILLRVFAMLVNGENYNPSLKRFLNDFSRQADAMDASKIDYLKDLFNSFLAHVATLQQGAFLSDRNRFQIALFEAVFTAVCEKPFSNRGLVERDVPEPLVSGLRTDENFVEASETATTSSANVKARREIARNLLSASSA